MWDRTATVETHWINDGTAPCSILYTSELYWSI